MRKEDQWNRQGSHEISGDGSCQISAFKLPCTDQDTTRRNFPGYQTHSFGEELLNAISCEGSTNTRGGKETNHSYKGYAGEMKRNFK